MRCDRVCLDWSPLLLQDREESAQGGGMCVYVGEGGYGCGGVVGGGLLDGVGCVRARCAGGREGR